jgi:GAF domain-containing protein
LLADGVSLAVEHRALRGRRAASRRLEFLAEASELLGSPLDHATALRRLSTLAVPYLGNWCLIDIVDPSGRLERLAVAHSDPERLAEDAAFRERFPPTLEAVHGPGYVIRTGRPELIHEVTEDHLREASGGDQKRLAGLREIGMTSSISLPLMARGRVLGALTLLSDRPERLYGPEDLATAEEPGGEWRSRWTMPGSTSGRRGDAARVLEHVADGVF